jgi:23S rRNA pseudouridine2605 synthase
VEPENRAPEKEGRERLQKVLAQAGVASRRHAEQLIAAGRVTVNGNRISALGTKVSREDRIQVDGRAISRSESLHYYLLNKPVSVITSVSDPQGRPTVLDLIKDVPVRVYPVGRLDYDTSGLLLLTNDGELAYRLMHPSYEIEKTYRAWVQGQLSINALKTLCQGVQLEDGITAPAKVKHVNIVSKGTRVKSKNNKDNKSIKGNNDNKVRKSNEGKHLEILEITIHEGRNRQIRRMFAAVGFPVVKLERIGFGTLTLENSLRSGTYRILTREEVKELRSQVRLST